MVARLRLASEPELVDGDGSGAPSIPVVLADSHRSMRCSLRLLLDGEEGIVVVGEAADLRQAMEQVEEEKPALLVSDLQLDGVTDGGLPDGLIDALPPGTDLVVLTIENVPGYARKVLEAGALALVSKQFADTELGPAIRAAARGEVYLSPPIAARLGSV